MPYGLFRTSYSHNPAPYSHIVKLKLHFYAHIWGGSLSHKTTLVQAHRGFRLLTLASYKSRKIHRNRHQIISSGEAQRTGLDGKIIASKIEGICHSV